MPQPSVTSIMQGNLPIVSQPEAIGQTSYGNSQDDFLDTLHFGYTGQRTHQQNILFLHGLPFVSGTWNPATDKAIRYYLVDSALTEGLATAPTNVTTLESTGTIRLATGNVLADASNLQRVLSMFDRVSSAGKTDPIGSQIQQISYFSSAEHQVFPLYPAATETPTPLTFHLEVLETVNKEWTDRLRSLTHLQPNWDGYGADPISEPATVQACQVLKDAAEKLQDLEDFQLFIAPMPDGGLEIDLTLPEERELMLVMPPEGTPIRFLSTTYDSTGVEIETEGTLGLHTSMTNLLYPAS